MKVLVATDRTQGERSDDYCGTVEGELVLVGPVAECDDPTRCGCGRGFPGLASSRATTTAMVVDRPMLTRQMVGDAIRESLDRQAWLVNMTPDEVRRGLDDELDAIERVARAFTDGTVLARSGAMVWPRQAAAA